MGHLPFLKIKIHLKYFFELASFDSHISSLCVHHCVRGSTQDFQPHIPPTITVAPKYNMAGLLNLIFISFLACLHGPKVQTGRAEQKGPEFMCR